MLRVIKQKAKESGDELSRQSSQDSQQRLPESATQNPLVMDVPHSISVPNSRGPSSSSSSVSSDGIHVLAPSTRVSSDETASEGIRRISLSAQDSPVESSPSGKANAPQKRKNDVRMARKVSDHDFNENDSVQEESAASKRRKISLSTSPGPSHLMPSLQLLAMPEDSSALNSLHTFVRLQIEVFSATPSDMALPAPGRKTPIKLHQVGLRCIHCRHLQSRDRVKRAICYPTSVSRIYHSVSDMKFDHFTSCRGFSPELRAKFQALKQECKPRGDKKTNGSSSTAQYYHDAACKMGLVDSREKEGIFMAGQVPDHHELLAPVISEPTQVPSPAPTLAAQQPPKETPADSAPDTSTSNVVPSVYTRQEVSQQSAYPAVFPSIDAQVLAMYHNLQNYNGVMFPQHMKLPLASSALFPLINSPVACKPLTTPTSRHLCLLAMSEDSSALNQLHCFVRRNVEVFVASKADVAAPAPGRRTRVKIGQVGIRCIHCAGLPIKDRVKRAVCYPPSVSGIYHSVSNMKFDHFGKCKGLSSEAQVEFASLKNSSNRRNTPSNNGSRGVTSSTAQYYEQSALRLGLMDTEGGIQFRELCQESTKSEEDSAASDGINALMIAATNPTIREEFDRRKAALLSETVGIRAAAGQAMVSV